MTPFADETMIGALLVGAGAGLALAGLGWTIIRRRRPLRIASPEDAASAAETALGGARVCGAVVGADGIGALAVTEDGRVAAVKRQGRHLVAREVPWRAVRSTARGIMVDTGDRRVGEVAIAGVDALDIRRLTLGPAR